MTITGDVGQSAFENCKALKTVKFDNSGGDINIGSSITSVGAFKGAGITSIDLRQVRGVEQGTFEGCSSLAEIHIQRAGQMGNKCLAYLFKVKTETVSYTDNATSVPASLKTVFYYDTGTNYANMFNGCSNIENLIWFGTSAATTALPANMFANMGTLKTFVTRGSTVKTDNNNAFTGTVIEKFYFGFNATIFGDFFGSGCTVVYSAQRFYEINVGWEFDAVTGLPKPN
jgi:hypothetical protein